MTTTSSHAITTIATDGEFAAGLNELTRAIKNLPKTLFRELVIWQARSRARHAMAAMSDAQLADAGLTREQVEGESLKPFWQA